MSECVPEGWKQTNIGDIATVKRGASPRPIKDPKWWGGKTGWVRISDVTASNKYLNKTTNYLSEIGVRKSVKINRGEVILSICATIGRPIIVNTEACIHDGFVWFDNLPESVDREFFYYFLADKEEFLSSQRQTGTQGNLNTSIVSGLGIFLPPKPEQQKIASILTSVDEVIERTEAQISKLQDLKKGMMQELLTKGIGHTEFKDSPVGRIPKEWIVRDLSTLVKPDKPITYGIVQAGENVEEGVPYIRVSDMSGNSLSPEGMLKTSNEIAEKYKRSEVLTSDIVYALRGIIGHVLKVPKSLNGANLTQGTARISPDAEIDVDYLIWAMRSPYISYQTDMKVKGSTFKEITLASLKKLQICIPSIEEQHQIARYLESVENSINANNEKKDAIVSIKKALMQDLLTGKVRVYA